MTVDWIYVRQAEARDREDRSLKLATEPKRQVRLMARTRVRIDEAGWGKLKMKTSQLVQQLTDDVYFDVLRFVPVDTGELKTSVKPRYPSWRMGRVWVGTDHWIYPEYGTRYMKAEPYMRPALYRYRRDLA